MEEVSILRIAPIEANIHLWAIAWNHTGSILASCSTDKVVRVWKHTEEAPYLECRTKIIDSHSRAIRSVTFSHDGKYLASGSFDSTIVIYERAESGDFEEVNKLEGHESEVKSVAFSPSDEFLATCSRDKSVWFWQIDEDEDFCVSSVLQPHNGDVKCVVWHPVEEILLSCSYDSSIRFYYYDGEDWVTHQHLADCHEGTVWHAAFSTDGKRLITVGEDDVIQVWQNFPDETNSRGTWKSVLKYKVENSRWPLFSVSWNHVTGLIAVGGGDGVVRVFQLSDGPPEALIITEVATYDQFQSDVNCVTWHPTECSLLAACSDDGTIRLLRMNA